MADRDILTDIASALALLSGARLVAALATLLLALIPRNLRTEEPELSAELAERVAKDVGSLDVPDAFDSERIRRDAARNNIMRRAEYAGAAVSRLAEVVSASPRGKRREALSRAYRAERRYFDSHRKMTEQRQRAAETVAAQVAQFGPRLRWKHQATRKVQEPRPSHKRADNRVYDLREGLPRGPDVLPGTLPGCSCAFTPV